MTEAASLSPPGPTVPSTSTTAPRLRAPAPSYPTYPTADRLSPAFGAADLERALGARRALSDAGICEPMSLEVRVPHAELLDAGAGAAGRPGPDRARALDYVEALELEIALVTDHVGACRTVNRLHACGSPTLLTDAQLQRLMATVRRSFFLTPDAELVIDVDPRTDDARLPRLRALGFDRLRVGVLDFDPDVQHALEREHSVDQVRALVRSARGTGFTSIEVGLVRGLPRQTPASFQQTLASAIALRPDGIRVRAFSPRRGRAAPCDQSGGDGAATGERTCLLSRAERAALEAAGYEYAGADLFELPAGSRSTHRDAFGPAYAGDRIALGVAAVGRVGDCAYQNEPTLDGWHAALEANRLPVARGLALDADDRARRDIVLALVGQGHVEFDDILARHDIDVRTAHAAELVALAPLVADGLVELRGDGIRLTASGQRAAHCVASVFDRHLNEGGRPPAASRGAP